MPTLNELINQNNRRAFIEAVANKAMQTLNDEVGLNHGFKTDQEIIDRIRSGDAIEFDFGRLLKEADKYV